MESIEGILKFSDTWWWLSTELKYRFFQDINLKNWNLEFLEDVTIKCLFIFLSYKGEKDT